MSLRSFHIFFILISAALLFGFGYWQKSVNHSLFSALVCAMLGILLLAYLVWFVGKIKKASHS